MVLCDILEANPFLTVFSRTLKAIVVVSLSVLSIAAGRAGEKAAIALPRSSPASQGVSSAGILDFVEAADKNIESMHSFMLLRHGHVVAEGWWSPYDAQTPHSLYSLSKSFTSTAVGLAIEAGKLSLSDEVLKFFPEDAPVEASNNLKSMRVRDLLRMCAGHQTEASLTSTNQPWTKIFLAHPVPNKPGTHFMYNTPATYMLSAIVQKVTGMPVLDYLRPRLFEPLGIDNPTWGTSPQGITLGGYGLSIRTEDIARFGQLYLQKGKWEGKQLIPAMWVEEATSRQTSNGSNPKSDWEQGYGYQFWRCRNGLFRGDGAFGQFCIVMPERDAVVAITSGVRDMQAVMNLVQDKILPALHASPLARDDGARHKLESTLAALTLRTQQGSPNSDVAAKESGKKYVFPTNEQRIESLAIEFEKGSGGATLVGKINGKEQRISCGNGAWRKGRLTYGAMPEQKIAASGAWISQDTYAAKIWFCESPFCLTMRLNFSEGKLIYDSEYNVFFGPTKRPQLVGHLE